MGTSNIFWGNNDHRPLLPDDYDGQADDEKEEVEQIDSPIVSWKTVKADMSKYVTQKGQYGSPRHIVSQYIRANGGANRLLSTSRAGVSAARTLADFLSVGISNEFETTLREFGIQAVGKSIHQVYSELINILAPSANTKEEIIARSAVQDSLSVLYEDMEKSGLEIEALESISGDIADQMMKTFISSYIWKKILNDLESRIEIYMQSVDNAYKREKEIKDYITSIVFINYEKEEIFSSTNLSEAVNNLYLNCLKALEGIV